MAAERDAEETATPFELRASLTLDASSAGIGFRIRAVGRGLLPDDYYYITSVVGDKPDVAIGLMSTGPAAAPRQSSSCPGRSTRRSTRST